jgi:excisionase family DNA binding protein
MATVTLYTTKQAAELLGLSHITLEIWRFQGKGPLYRKLGRSVRYAENDLNDFINQGLRSNTSQTPEQAKRLTAS